MQTEGSSTNHAHEVSDLTGEIGSNSEKLLRMARQAVMPGVVFAMRYPDNTGFVWNTIARTRDLAAFHLVRLQIVLSHIQNYPELLHIKLNTYSQWQ